YRPLILENVALIRFLLKPLEHRVDGVDEVKNGGVRAGHWRFVLELELAGGSRKNIRLPQFQSLKLAGGVFELLVLHQLADQFPARIFAFLLTFEFRALLDRKQFTALDEHERRRHDEEFAGDLQVQQSHRLDILDELRGQSRQIHLVNIDLLLLDQVQEQVERAFENFEFYLILSHRNGPPS